MGRQRPSRGGCSGPNSLGSRLVGAMAVTVVPGGGAWRQTIFYPFMFASRHGRGTALQLDVECESYDADIAAGVSYLDIAGVHDGDAGTLTFFAINRKGDEPLQMAVSMEGFGAAKSVEHMLIRHDDLEATNTENNPDNVKPVRVDGATVSGGKLSITLPAWSYSMIRVTL